MASITIDAYNGWSEDQLRKRCRQLARAGIRKDLLICSLVEVGSVDAMPAPLAAQVREIVKIYCEE